MLARLVAILLISLLAMAPGLASTSAASQPECGMAGMQHEMDGAGARAKALAAICKVQCQATAMLPQHAVLARKTTLKVSVLQGTETALPSLSTQPESPPPRA